MILERARKGRGEERAFLADILPDRGLDVAAAQCRGRSFGWSVSRHGVSSLCEMTVTLSRQEERHRTGHGGKRRQRLKPAGLRGPRRGSDRLTGASGAPHKCQPVGHRRWRPDTAEEIEKEWSRRFRAQILPTMSSTHESGGMIHIARSDPTFVTPPFSMRWSKTGRRGGLPSLCPLDF